MQQVGYHHASALSSNITSSLQTQPQEQNDQLASFLSTMPSLTTTITESEESEPSIHSSNSASATNNVQLEMLKLLQEISREIKLIGDLATTPRTPGMIKRRHGRKPPDNQVDPPRDVTDKHCWIHGHCNHHESQCRHKSEKHRNSTKRKQCMQWMTV